MPCTRLIALLSFLSAFVVSGGSTAVLPRQTDSSLVTACKAIDAALPGQLAFENRDYLMFHDVLDAYWSRADADLVPGCIAFPFNVQDTSRIVGILNDHPDVPFAVKSGGHNPNQGWSSIHDGVLIAMSKNAATNLSADGLTADIGPGSRWVNVVQALEPYGKAVVGGRVGEVGVGGFLLGGGLSFLSGEYGLACDNVVNFEVVLANASIVNANSTSNPDLFQALKGGGNQFGIVTKFTMQTIPIGQIWGGTRTYFGSEKVAGTLINATHRFTASYTDPKASVIVTTERNTLVNIWVVFFFYNGPTPPSEIFAGFEGLYPIIDTVKTQSFASLIKANDAVVAHGFRYLIRGTTLPLFPGTNGTDLLNHQYTTWAAQADAQTSTDIDFIYSMAYQPMPIAIPLASQKQSSVHGPNSLNLDPLAGDHMWMEYDISWFTALGDANAHAQAINLTEYINAYSRRTYPGVYPNHYVASAAASPTRSDLEYQLYNPIFANDGMYDQRPLQSYPKAEYDRLVSAKRRWDPEGFFTNRTGGFKL